MDKSLDEFEEWVVVRLGGEVWHGEVDTFARTTHLAKTFEKVAGKLWRPYHYGVKNVRTGSILPAVIL